MLKLKLETRRERYYVNEEKKVVVFKSHFLFRSEDGPNFSFDAQGKARCNDEDVFNVEVGKKIARDRAFLKARMKFQKIVVGAIENFTDTIRVYEEFDNQNYDAISRLIYSLSENGVKIRSRF